MELRPDSGEASSLPLRRIPSLLFTFYFDVRALNVVFVNLELTLWSSLESVIPSP